MFIELEWKNHPKKYSQLWIKWAKLLLLGFDILNDQFNYSRMLIYIKFSLLNILDIKFNFYLVYKINNRNKSIKFNQLNQKWITWRFSFSTSSE